MIKQTRFWLRTLNVREEEGWLVKQLFLLQFLQGAGIAFFFTASFALFLDRFEITELPYVFIYAAFLLWLMGFLYSRAERFLSNMNLALGVTLFMAVSIIAFRIAWHYFDSAFFFYFMLAWFNVLYLLNNLEFWGLASLLFNVRQSKRLFSVISAGDIPAKFFGYSMALVIVGYVGTINLLILGFICMMLSVPFLLRIRKSGKIPALHHHAKQSVPQGGVIKLVNNLTGNSLTRSLAVLSIVVTCSFLLVNFAFYAGVKSSYNNEVTLAKFIAFFLAMVRVAALVIKMILTSRLINRFGNINSLLITPAAMLVMVLVIVATQSMDVFPKLILYLFGITSIVVDILRSSINSPVFLTLMQPLPAHERLRAHTVVKGIMDPFASLITGFILIAVIELHGNVNLLTLCYILLAFTLLWFGAVSLVNRNYISTVLRSITSKFFNNTQVSFDDRNTLAYLKDKVQNGSEARAINILEMLSGSSRETQAEISTLALEHPSEKVRSLALDTIAFNGLDVPRHNILKHLSDASEIVSVSALHALKEGDCEELILPMLNADSEKVRAAAITALINSRDERCSSVALAELNKMLSSSMPKSRATAALILAHAKGDTYANLIKELMADPSREVREASFKAAAKTGEPFLIGHMMDKFAGSSKEIIPALIETGEPALSFISKYILSGQATSYQIEKLLLVCGKIGGAKAKLILLTFLTSHPEFSLHVAKALYRAGFAANASQAVVITEQVKRVLDKCETIIRMQRSLATGEARFSLVIEALGIELDQCRDELLYLFTLLYNKEKINKVRYAYASGKRERIINAMEIIDHTVRKDFARRFNLVFEPGNLQDKVPMSQKGNTENFFTAGAVLEYVLHDESGTFNFWTKSCALYLGDSLPEPLNSRYIKKYREAESPLLRETALRSESFVLIEKNPSQKILRPL